MKNRLLLFAILLSTILVAIYFSFMQESPSTSKGDPLFGQVKKENFVGDRACQSCHTKEYEEWQNSHHDYAMRKADSTTVRGDFNNVTFTEDGQTYRFFREGKRYFVEAPDTSGQMKTFSITYTFGWTPLQQYLVDFGRGKLQALDIAWDTQEEQWFSLHPDDRIEPGNWLHWTGGAMNWNTMCADCHSTQLEQNYQPHSDTFNTTWTSINVSCESCHGPGKEHVDFVQSDQADQASIERIRQDLLLTKYSKQVEQVNTCARCHSIREKLIDEYDHEKDFMDHFNPILPHPELYFADGQIREEVYVYASFLQSKMFKSGVKCIDCHNPHTLDLKQNVTDNKLCMQCHEPTYNTIKHHFHEPNTEASQCINCHMPGRYYMVVDYRRDHSFRVPRPDLSSEFGTPNACNDCHEQKSPEWAASAVEQWYGSDRSPHFSETLLKAYSSGVEALPELTALIGDTSQPDMARATAMWYVGQYSEPESTDLLITYLDDENPILRKSAARAISSSAQQIQQRNVLIDALGDSIKAVRISAMEGLKSYSAADVAPGLKRTFNQAKEEYLEYLNVNQYFPSGLVNQGQFFEQQGKPRKALEAYQKALDQDSLFNPARLNLAYLYNTLGEKGKTLRLLEEVIDLEPSYGEAYYSLGLLLAERGRLQEAVSRFEEATALMPDHARLRYNLAISYQNLKRPDEAERMYLEAIDIAPEHPDYRYGIVTLYIQQQEYEKALVQTRKLLELDATNPNYERVMQIVEERMKQQ